MLPSASGGPIKAGAKLHMEWPRKIATSGQPIKVIGMPNNHNNFIHANQLSLAYYLAPLKVYKGFLRLQSCIQLHASKNDSSQEG